MKKIIFLLVLLVAFPVLSRTTGPYTNSTVPLTNGGTGATSSSAALANLNGLRAWPTKRPPAPTDSTSLGYLAGQFWNYNGQIWYSQSVTAGQSNWERMSVNNLSIGDAASVTPAMACGVVKIMSAYTGHALQITRSSDSTTLDVDFLTSGDLDWNAADNFCKNTSCGVNICYDQTGHGENFVQATLANMPYIRYDYSNNIRGITFPYGFTVYWQNSTLALTNARNISVLWSGNKFSSAVNEAIWEVGNPTVRFTMEDVSSSGVYVNGTLAALDATGPFVKLVATNGASSGNYVQNDMNYAIGAPASAAVTGFTWENGLGLVSYPGKGVFTMMAIYNSTLSATDQRSVLQASYGRLGIQPQGRDIFVWVGDSHVQGSMSTGSDMNSMEPYQVQAMISHPFFYYNAGHSGGTAQGMVSESATYAARTYNAGALNIVAINAGTNDIAANNTAANVITYLQQICSAYKAAGFSKCAVETCLPRSAGFSGGQNSPGFETQRLLLNASIRSASWVDAVMDAGADPVVGPASSLGNVSLWIDNIHLTTPLGASYAARQDVLGLTPLIQ